MKLLITNVAFNSKTKEFTFTRENLEQYESLKQIAKEENRILKLSDVASYGLTEIPDTFEIDVPYDSLIENINEVDTYVKEEIKKITTRDVKAFCAKRID